MSVDTWIYCITVYRLAELSRLERLDLSVNDFSQRGLPDSVYTLTNLKVLDMRKCGLSSIDDRLV